MALGAPKMLGAVDVLFVDEAGQISLANVLAMSRAARSLVLLGDPQQLDQPLQGHASAGRRRSALAHVLGDQADDAGRPRGCSSRRPGGSIPTSARFTSEVFYDDRLEPEAHLGSQRVDAATRSSTAPALAAARRSRHVGADNESPDEADAVAELARTLVDGGATWIDRHGATRPVGWNDVLIVAPYNAQVGAISARGCRPRRASAPSTSSRARRRRSASTR